MKKYIFSIVFTALIATIGLGTAQQAFAGFQCELTSQSNEDWDSAFNQIPTSSDTVCIEHVVTLNGVGLADILVIDNRGSLFIGCDGDLTVDLILDVRTLLTNHGSVDTTSFFISSSGLVQNSSSAFTFDNSNIQGTFENISTICSQPIGGTVGSMDTTSLLIAGAQANMGWGIIALVGVVVGVGIAYKAKSNKTDKETL